MISSADTVDESQHHGSSGATLRKYAALVRASMRRTVAERGDLLARLFFYYALLFIFGQFWKAVLALDTGLQYSHAQMLWYLAVTEWVILSLPDLHLRMEEDARSGDVVYRLSRPISYFWGKVAEGVGALAVRLAVIGTGGFVGTALMVGFPLELEACAAIAITGIIASGIGLLSLAMVGLTGIWLRDVSPTFLVWQKLTFVLGGLILPLEIYPHWLRTIAEWTPFHATLYAAGRWALSVDGLTLARTVAVQVGWLLLLTMLAQWIARRAIRRLEKRGE
ncbi:MAG: ABC-2 family transporter protein [Planctomycetota bacterium]